MIIPAHEGQLAALQFSPSGQRIATASVKGTVIRYQCPPTPEPETPNSSFARVFSCHDGAKLYELRRGERLTGGHDLVTVPVQCVSLLVLFMVTIAVITFPRTEAHGLDLLPLLLPLWVLPGLQQ